MTSALGVSPGALIGSKCFWNMHQTDEPPTLCVHTQMLKDGESHTIELFIEPLDGWFSVTATPLKNKEGKIVGALHIARDITQRKNIEEKLKETEFDLHERLKELTGIYSLGLAIEKSMKENEEPQPGNITPWQESLEKLKRAISAIRLF